MFRKGLITNELGKNTMKMIKKSFRKAKGRKYSKKDKKIKSREKEDQTSLLKNHQFTTT